MATPNSPRRGIRTAAKVFAALTTGLLSACSTSTTQPVASPSAFLDAVAEQIGLPATTWTASGTHTAKGYVGATGQTTNAAGMKADCDNINLNKKLAGDFRSDVFGPGLKGFFYKCENVSPDTNKYWFTISSADQAQIDKLCDAATSYPIVYDQQHDTYWVDEPFNCDNRTTGPGATAASNAEAPAAVGAAPPLKEDSPQDPASGFQPPSGCGQDTDTDTLWLDVKNATPKDRGPNIAVRPDKGDLHYALHNGNRKGDNYKYNLLVIPTKRITGIECKEIFNTNYVLNLWKYAWEEARNQFPLKPGEIMLGINSMDGRSHDQLHIHLTGFNARAQLEKLTNVPTDLTKWNDSLYVLGEHAYRIVHVPSLETNPFNLLEQYVVQKFQDRFQQSLAVVADNKNEGFYLIATQGKPKYAEQPKHTPELRVEVGKTTYWGTETVEGLMNRG